MKLLRTLSTWMGTDRRECWWNLLWRIVVITDVFRNFCHTAEAGRLLVNINCFSCGRGLMHRPHKRWLGIIRIIRKLASEMVWCQILGVFPPAHFVREISCRRRFTKEAPNIADWPRSENNPWTEHCRWLLWMFGFRTELAGAISQLLLLSYYRNWCQKGLICHSSHCRPLRHPRAHQDGAWPLLSFTSLVWKPPVHRSSPLQPDFRSKLCQRRKELMGKIPLWSPFY